MVVQTLSRVLRCAVTDFDMSLVHSALGAGIPKYEAVVDDLYAAALSIALRDVHLPVQLVPPSHDTAVHNVDGQWLWYDGRMEASVFVTAFLLRIGVLAPHLRVTPTRCSCGTPVTNDNAQVMHAMLCDRFTSATHTTRHNLVRDAACRVANVYGISTTKEPTCYVYEAGRRRPDVLFHTLQPIVTDFTIVAPRDEPCEAAVVADQHKRDVHTKPAQRLSHKFIPAALESWGTFGPGSLDLIREPSLTDMATPVRSHSWTRMSAEHVRRPYQQMMSCEISSTCVRWERWLGWSSSLGRDTVSLSLTVVAHSHS